jgi:hypothetical protein
MAAVTGELADRVNENAAPGDRVTAKQLKDRVRYHEGKDKNGNSDLNASPQNSDENSGNSGNIPMSEAAQRVEAQRQRNATF